MALLASNASAADLDGVIMTGYNVQFGDMAVSESALGRSQLCAADGEASLLNLINSVADRVEERLSSGGIPASERAQEARTMRSELCEGTESFSVDAYAMTYANCRMAMDTASVLTDISLPPGGGPPTMTMSDFYRAESSTITMDRELAATPVANAELSEVSWSGPGESKQIAGYPATRWGFEYQGKLSAGISATLNTSGQGYWSSEVPGSGLVNGFFDTWTREVKAGQAADSMFSGMLNTMVNMLQKGIPLEMEQTISTSIAGMSQRSMRSRMKATGVRTVGLQDDYCTRSLAPDYFETIDLNAQLKQQGAMTGAGDPGAPDMNDLMGELSKAMEGMTPEQREAMQGMGLGSLFGSQGGAATPPQAAPSAGSTSSGSRSSASSALRTDNLTQSVQLHLQELGYDPGNTDGELSTSSIIAISQFQAENGLEVTGEVTPQLLGILAARVDAR